MDAENLRRWNKRLFFLWIFPGVPVSILLRNSLAWVVFLSVYAIVVAHFIEWRQEHKETNDGESVHDGN